MTVFENRVLRRIFRPKKFGVTRKWRELHNEQLRVRFEVFHGGDYEE
jgi:hypothetical protein